jgi:hypothetical protein
MITRTSRHLPIAVILAGLSLLAVESTAQQLHLEAHLLAEPRAVVSTVDISQAQELATIDARPSITRCRFGRRNVAAGCSRERLPER